jgi:cell division protein FtsW (lipid II flippase)
MENTAIEKSFAAAVQARNLELDLFWKRSLHFWGFVAAAFVAFAAVKSHSFGTNAPWLPIVIVALGFVCSVAWTLANRGSKSWQEEWENKVEAIEQLELGMPLFGSRSVRERKAVWLRSSRFSVRSFRSR